MCTQQLLVLLQLGPEPRFHARLHIRILLGFLHDTVLLGSLEFCMRAAVPGTCVHEAGVVVLMQNVQLQRSRTI